MSRAAGAALAVAVAAAAIAGGCGGSATCQLVTAPPGAAPFLWKVGKPGAAGRVYLFGTVHNGAADTVPAAAWAALAGSPRLVSELGDLVPDPDALRAITELPRGDGLPQLLGPDDWYELRDALRGAYPEDALKRVRPWFAMARLAAAVAPPPRPTMDDALADRARAAHLPIDHLETWDDQLATLADSVSVDALREAIHARATMKCELAQIRATYESGDQTAMQQILVGKDAPRLLTPRNQRWLPQIEALAAADGGFVAVGLGHMLGEAGLLAMLTGAGYTVERVLR